MNTIMKIQFREQLQQCTLYGCINHNYCNIDLRYVATLSSITRWHKNHTGCVTETAD
jgi:hypothetical protein